MPKKTSRSSEDFRKKIKLAEEAVSKVSDPSLKSVAFQTVLQSLLADVPQITKKSVHRDKESEEGSPPKPPKGTQGRIEELVSEGFFDQKRAIGEIQKELGNHGWQYPVTHLATPLLRLVKDKKLRRVAEPAEKGGKVIWQYSKW